MFPELTRDDVFRLETKRLWLRWPRAADAAAFAQLAGEENVARWTANIPHPYPRAAADAFILSARRENAEGAALKLALALRTRPQEAIGGIGLIASARPGTATLGYWLGQPYQGEGLMAEAVEALLSMVFGVTSIEEIEATVLPANAPSLRVLRHVGFERDGRRMSPAPARGGDQEVEIWRLDRAAFLAPYATPRPLPVMREQARRREPAHAALALAGEQ